MPELFRSSRLSFHTPSMDDLDALAAMWSDPAAMRFVGHGGAWTHEKVEERLQRAMKLYEAQHMAFWTVKLADTNEVIGQAGVVPVEGRHPAPEDWPIELGYRFGVAHWGHGYATEAAIACANHATDPAGPLALERLIAVAHPDNLPSHRVLVKAGFTPRGTTDAYYSMTLALFDLHCS